jgi:hypothetical protein
VMRLAQYARGMGLDRSGGATDVRAWAFMSVSLLAPEARAVAIEANVSRDSSIMPPE